MVCEHCGKEHETLRRVITGELYTEMWCDSCIEEDASICSHCGELYESDSGDMIHGDGVCPECVGNDAVRCERCDELEWRDNVRTIHTSNGEELWCDSCADDYSTECGCCGEEWSDDDIRYDGQDCAYCPDCYDEYVDECSECGYTAHRDNLIWDEDSEAYYCEDCYSERSHIRGYHNEPHGYYFFGKDRKAVDVYDVDKPSFKGLGIELEVDGCGYSDRKPSCEHVLELIDSDNNEIYFCEDGSLDTGFENITMPHDEDAFWSMDWEGILKSLSDDGWKSHDTSTCGLHIHVSRAWFGDSYDEQMENIYKVLAFYERNWTTLLKMSRRTGANGTHYAERYLGCGQLPTMKTIKKIKPSTRYRTVNLMNQYTVEYRLGRGTLNYRTFKAWIDFHMAITKNAKNISWEEIDNIGMWLYGITEETKAYLSEKDLFGFGESEFEKNPIPFDMEELAEFEDYATRFTRI